MRDMEISDVINSVEILLDGAETKQSQTVKVDTRSLECILAYIAKLEQREKQLEDGWREAEKRHEDRVAELLSDNDQLERQLEEKEDENERLRNWNKMLTAPKYDPKKKYTKDELMDCMQYACDVMEPFVGPNYEVIHDDRNGALRLQVIDIYGHIGNIKYHEPPTPPPAKDRIVMVRGFWQHEFKIIYVKSRGKFDFVGRLICDSGHVVCADDDIHWDYWCDYLDRSHHSANWKREWE